MRILVFDTETTGLPLNRKIPAKNLRNNWPHIVSISWIIMENDTPLYSRSHIIKPNGWVIPEESVKIHGISHYKATTYGEELDVVIDQFLREKYDIMVAHNIEFDENVIVNAVYWDLGRKYFHSFPQIKYCTMELTRNLCRIPSLNPQFYKSPKLSELYSHVFGKTPDIEKLHTSMYDVELLVSIIQHYTPLREKLGLVKRNIVNTNDYSKICTTLYL